MSSALRVNASVRRAGFTLDVTLEARAGQVLAVLGPNGAGKSTLLRAVAGLLAVTSGRIVLGQEVLDDAATGEFREPARRRVGVVFQDHRLFPNLHVLDNVAFGPRASGASRAEARERARKWLEWLGLGALTGRNPADLSGGQAQRVALARALASDPVLLLLDEPLAALDVQTRAEVQADLGGHLATFAGPTLLVTHDPIEALLLAGRIVVLENGRIVQDGTPAEITRQPATDYVARLVGVNLHPGIAGAGFVRLDVGGVVEIADPRLTGRVLVAVRPSAITIHSAHPGASSARNLWPGRITTLSPLADRVRIVVDGTRRDLVDVTTQAVAELRLRPGTEVWLAAKATDLSVYPDPHRVN
ncbi:MAG: ABC transporter ATP-binding protein [Actinomycetota bacterium]